MTSQNDMVEAWLREGRSITSRQAISMFGITRLAARIADLEQAGLVIESRMVPVTNRYGKTVRVARYRLAGKVVAA